MKTLLRILLPALVVYFGYTRFGIVPGTIIMLAVFAVMYIIYRVEIYMIFAKLNYMKNNDKTFDYLEKAYRTGRMTNEQKLYYGYMCLREGRLEKAEKMINAVLAFKLDPKVKSQAKLNYALLLWKKGNTEEAVKMTEEVFEDYKTTIVYGNLGFLYLESGDLDRALEFNKEAYEYNEDNEVIADNLAQVYYKLGEYDKSREIYNRFIDKKITSPTFLYNISKTLVKTGDKELAIKFLKEALGLHFAGVASVEKETVENYLKELEESE